MEGVAGFEPAAYGTKNRRSTAELHPLKKQGTLRYAAVPVTHLTVGK